MTRHEKAVEKVEAKRDELEGLAESDNPASWVAELLLEAAEQHATE